MQYSINRAEQIVSPPVRRSRLLAAILSGSLALQLVLVGGGTTCVDPGHVSSQLQPAANIAMDMSSGMPGHDATGGVGDIPARDEAPCEKPATPSVCQVLAACASGFVASVLSGPDARAPISSQAVTRTALALASRTIPPELPPPRV